MSGDRIEGHGGRLAMEALARFGVNELFTLSGAHVFPLYDAAVDMDVRIYGVRHEQTATFAAEGLAKLTRRPGVAALTAGPGVTNGVSAIATARHNGSPLVVLGGRAAEEGWGRGALQEFDHVPVVASVTKWAHTVRATNDIGGAVTRAATESLTPHRGPTFLDLPLDVVFGQGSAELGEAVPPVGVQADPDAVARAVALLAGAERPALLVGSDVYWDGAWDQLRAAAETLRLPVFANGLGRGLLPADHDLSFSRVRGLLKAEADVVAVLGTPLDFRVGFGVFGDAQVIHVTDSPDGVSATAQTAESVVGGIGAVLAAWADHAGEVADHEPWIGQLTEAEASARAGDAQLLAAAGDPILPTRVYGELAKVLDRDAVVICDGGDFVSYAGKYVDSHLPGRWLDPGPFGCLGTGMGYAMAARVAHPDAQVVVLMGDGAAGFSLMDVESLVREQLPVVILCGNNGIWGLEKHPMRFLYGYDVAADLQPGLRYDQVVQAMGGGGEMVTEPTQIAPALQRGFDAGVPYLVNVLTDPADAYPRSSNLA